MKRGTTITIRNTNSDNVQIYIELWDCMDDKKRDSFHV